MLGVMNDRLADLDRALRHSNTVVLVEGASDRAALEALAVRANQSLAGVAIVPIGGAGGIGPALGPGSNAVALTDEQIIDVIRIGPGSMTAFGDRFTDAQFDSLVEYLRAEQGS